MWAFSPLSGQGAAIHGGRFNPKGMPALYLSLSIDTAVTEAAQGFAGKLEPLTICLYEVDCDGIIDLSTPGARDAAGVGPGGKA
jgi:RES domain-containing protein